MLGNIRTITAERFLLAFSLQNFFFHATTACDILRLRGVPIGKRDFRAGAEPAHLLNPAKEAVSPCRL